MMFGGEREFRRWAPIGGDRTAQNAKMFVTWQRAGIAAALLPPTVASVTVARSASSSTIGVLFTYVMVVSVVTQTIAFIYRLRVRRSALAYWAVGPEEKSTFVWTTSQGLEAWLAVHRPRATGVNPGGEGRGPMA